METIRSFIAIELNSDLHQALAQVIARCSALTRAVHWVPAQNIHLTLQFLGDIPQPSIPLLQKALHAEALQHASFEIQIGELGAFPSLRRPRVVWVGVQAPPELPALQKGVEAAMLHLGYPAEDRPFSPHLTLGRTNSRAVPDEVQTFGTALAKIKVGLLGSLRVASLALFRSDLRPTGAVYTRLYEAKFK